MNETIGFLFNNAYLVFILFVFIGYKIYGRIFKEDFIGYRAARWTVVNLIIASSPIIFSLIISLFFESLSWLEIVHSSLIEGAILVIAVSLSGTQFVTFTYARDFEELDTKTQSRISVGFIITCVSSTLVFACIQILNNLINEKKIEYSYPTAAIIITSLSILCFSIFYTFKAQLIKIGYDIIYNNLKIPSKYRSRINVKMLGNDDIDFEEKVSRLNKMIRDEKGQQELDKVPKENEGNDIEPKAK